METIKEAKEHIAKNALEGVECPCCKQFFKVYKRTINGTMAKTLIRIYNKAKQVGFSTWLHIRRDINNGREPAGDYAKLRYWGLIEERDGHSGYWRVTPNGRRFVERDISVPKYALVLSRKCLKLDDTEKITITDALGKKFDLKELLSA